MRTRAVDRPRLLGFTGALIAVLAAWNGLVVTRLPGSAVVANVPATVVVLAAARATGLGWDEVGLGRRRLPSGLRLGGVCAGLVVAGYAAALAVPGVRPLLADARIAHLDGGQLAYATLVRVPLGTVLWEEVAFRGVLLAALSRLVPRPTAVAASAAVFGIWHIRPTLSGLAANDLADGAAATTAAVLLACLGTAAAGVGFSWLRLRSGSLLAPALLHLATNSTGTLAAAAATRLG
ncbi:CPBP family intramembrane glutamic endopeptidase [Modestobacter altitudinis]|uniref:CPBP family intramembrane glutamic endopeptidase n=1 Tax=Modestobacter altitudinis TaxID=2213158 RepID=UPI001FE5ED0E|nr:CPBP family intramembrane glutamic endopeptidase [Modestobacter altitudinis]